MGCGHRDPRRPCGADGCRCAPGHACSRRGSPGIRGRAQRCRFLIPVAPRRSPRFPCGGATTYQPTGALPGSTHDPSQTRPTLVDFPRGSLTTADHDLPSRPEGVPDIGQRSGLAGGAPSLGPDRRSGRHSIQARSGESAPRGRRPRLFPAGAKKSPCRAARAALHSLGSRERPCWESGAAPGGAHPSPVQLPNHARSSHGRGPAECPAAGRPGEGVQPTPPAGPGLLLLPMVP